MRPRYALYNCNSRLSSTFMSNLHVLTVVTYDYPVSRVKRTVRVTNLCSLTSWLTGKSIVRLCFHLHYPDDRNDVINCSVQMHRCAAVV